VAFGDAYGKALLACAALLAAGGLVSWLTISRGPLVREDADEREPVHVSAHQLDCPHRGH
jgi:hypothetical protein